LHLLNDFYETNKDIYNIFIVYINEAHACDVWNIGESAGSIIYSHKLIEDRVMYANKFKNDYHIKIPIYCDNINNNLETYFSAWPVRYYVFSSRETNMYIDMIGNPEDSELDIIELFDFLLNFTK
jgi:hypothetical protein